LLTLAVTFEDANVKHARTATTSKAALIFVVDKTLLSMSELASKPDKNRMCLKEGQLPTS
jgi:hypothetical protein